jgi:hypothetical protein
MQFKAHAFRCRHTETRSSYLYGGRQRRQPICLASINQYKHSRADGKWGMENEQRDAKAPKY